MTVEVSRVSETYERQRPLWKAEGVLFAAATDEDFRDTMRVLFPRRCWAVRNGEAQVLRRA
jgi:hypothetical protein